MAIMASAQNYEYTGAFGMPYVSLNGGVISSLNVNDWNEYVNTIKPVAGIEFGTYVTPVWGFSFDGQAAFNTLGTHTIVDQTNVVLNGKVNISNLLAGYKGYPRRIELVAVPGIGWGHQYGTEEEVFDRNYLTYNAGAELNLNLGKQRAWQVNVKPGVVWSTFDSNIKFDKRNAAARLLVGVTYKFGNKRVKSHNFVTNDYAVTQHDYDVLLAKYEECSKRQPEVKEVPVEKVVEKTVVDTVDVPTYFGKTFVKFHVGSATITENEKATIDEFAKNVNEETIVHIVGSADSGTGTHDYNVNLARRRAEAVKNYLYSNGVKANNITIDDTLDAGSAVSTSRSAVLTLELVETD